MQRSMIVAIAKQRVIGRENGMPWHLPADLAHFKKTTWGKPLVMGRRTFESLGKPLPGRPHIVLTRQSDWDYPGVTVVDNLESAWLACGDATEVMVVGGAKVYEQALPYVTRLYVTIIDIECEGDTWFPEWQDGSWQLVSEQAGVIDDKNRYPHRFCVYERERS